MANQLQTYIDHIKTHFDDYKKCYERHYEQKKELGLISKPSYPKIKIIEPVCGIVIVGYYSGLAKEKIAKLLSKHPSIQIKQCFNEIYYPSRNS